MKASEFKKLIREEVRKALTDTQGGLSEGLYYPGRGGKFPIGEQEAENVCKAAIRWFFNTKKGRTSDPTGVDKYEQALIDSIQELLAQAGIE